MLVNVLYASHSILYSIIRRRKAISVTMDILPSGNIFRELQDIHDTGYFSSQGSIEDQWHQVCTRIGFPYECVREYLKCPHEIEGGR